ncbi:MAG: hypothetical protein ABFE07_16950 [Armatimonadia bacterium]
MDCDEELKAHAPAELKSILAGEPSWCGHTPHGLWAADKFRAHWTCPLEELPQEVQRVVTPMKDYLVWTPGKDLARWLKLVARHAGKKPAYVLMTDDAWHYEAVGDPIASVLKVAPPFGAVDYKFDAQFLADALAFLGDNRSAIGLSLTQHILPAGCKSWFLSNKRANYQRYACVAPARTLR